MIKLPFRARRCGSGLLFDKNVSPLRMRTDYRIGNAVQLICWRAGPRHDTGLEGVRRALLERLRK